MLNAIAIYLLINQINKKPYKIYTNKHSRNPFTIYISIDENTFSNIYINCQYFLDVNKCLLKDISLNKYIQSNTNIYKI